MDGSTQLIPYLTLYGRCDEAMAFYQQHLGAQIGMVMRFNEMPDSPPDDMLHPEFNDKVMHCEITIGATTFFASDGGFPGKQVEGMSFAVEVPTKEEADALFNALVSGGSEVMMPMMETFWSPYFGMVNDPFNVGWMIMLPEVPQA
jgi:PhnB protein